MKSVITLLALTVSLFLIKDAIYAQSNLNGKYRVNKYLESSAEQKEYESRENAKQQNGTRISSSTASIQSQITSNGTIRYEDSDDDGMPDDWEIVNGLDPNNPKDAWSDIDHDAVINLFEYQLQSDPQDQEKPEHVNIAIGEDICAAYDSASSGVVFRVQEGHHFVNCLTYDNKSAMFQGGWNQDFTARNPGLNQTTLDGHNMKILSFDISQGMHAIILDDLTLINSGPSELLSMTSSREAIVNYSVMNCRILNLDPTYYSFGAVLISHRGDSKSNIYIIRSIVANNRSNGIYSSASSASPSRAEGNWKIVNSVVTNNQNQTLSTDKGYGFYAFTLGSASISIDLKNSIIWGNEKTDIQISDSITLNAMHSNVGSVETLLDAIYNTGSGMFNTDPLFIDENNADFRLTDGSLLIDAGIDVGLPFAGAAPDIGAIEHGMEAAVAEQDNSVIPSDVKLLQNYPNPFNSTTVIRYELPVSSKVTLKIYDLLGKEVMILANDENHEAGYYELVVDLIDFASGIYFYRLLVFGEQRFEVTKKMIFVK